MIGLGRDNNAEVILGLDPGKTTGYAFFSGTELVEAGEIPGGLKGFLEWWDDRVLMHDTLARIVMEEYVPLEGFRGKDQTHSLQIQGAVIALSGVEVVLQTRSDKATLFNQTFTGDKGEAERFAWLRERGLDSQSGHALDAVTHVLVNRKRVRDMRFWMAYWA